VVSASEQAVTYACNDLAAGVLDAHGDGQGELRRYWAYGFNAALTNPTSLITGSNALLATKVSGCSIDYSNVNQRNGLVAIHLTLTSGGESISLYSETHVNNMP
jgi:MSHA biogenesis protein MshO